MIRKITTAFMFYFLGTLPTLKSSVCHSVYRIKFCYSIVIRLEAVYINRPKALNNRISWAALCVI